MKKLGGVVAIIFLGLLTFVGAALRSGTKINFGRHFGHHHQELLPPQYDRAPAGNFSLAAGISAVMSQLQLSCVEEEQFRALNLDITCPSHVPHLETCSCILRDNYGDLIKKVDGKKSFESKCVCDASRDDVSGLEHVITRATCCSRVRTSNVSPLISANTAQQSAQLLLCPAEAPFKTKYRSLKGLVRCGTRLVGKCLCLESNISSQSQKRHVGTVIGTECHCKKRISGWDKYSRNENVIVRAVCCSENKYAESGEVVFTQ